MSGGGKYPGGGVNILGELSGHLTPLLMGRSAGSQGRFEDPVRPSAAKRLSTVSNP